MGNGYLLDANKLGKRINELRHDKNGKIIITLDNLAKKCGLSGKAAISKYENGKVPNITVDTLLRFADALECEPDYLLDRIQHPKRSTSDIAEKLPLRRDAIESLERMKMQIEEHPGSDASLLTYHIISDIIIHIEKSLNQDSINDSIISNIGDMFDAYSWISEMESSRLNDDHIADVWLELKEGASINKDNKTIKEKASNKVEYRMQRLTIRGTSSWLGNDIAEVIRQSVKKYADPDNIAKEEA